MFRIQRQTAGTITVEVRDATGALADATGNVPVAITDSAGGAVVSGTATRAAVGKYSFVVIPTYTVDLDIYTATWTPTVGGYVQTYTTEYEVCGGFYFSLTEARAYENGFLADTVTYPDALLVEKRAVVEERFEREAYTAGVPRGMRWTTNGDWQTGLLLPKSRIRRINTITSDGVAFTVGQLAAVTVNSDAGLIQLTSGNFSGAAPQNIAVYFEYGMDQPPEWVKEGALYYLCRLCSPSNEDERILSMTNEVGVTTRFSSPGMRYPTGWPRVDSAIFRFSDRFLHVG